MGFFYVAGEISITALQEFFFSQQLIYEIFTYKRKNRDEKRIKKKLIAHKDSVNDFKLIFEKIKRRVPFYYSTSQWFKFIFKKVISCNFSFSSLKESRMDKLF